MIKSETFEDNFFDDITIKVLDWLAKKEEEFRGRGNKIEGISHTIIERRKKHGEKPYVGSAIIMYS